MEEKGIPFNSLEELCQVSGGRIYPGYPNKVCKKKDGVPKFYTVYGWLRLDPERDMELYNMVAADKWEDK